MEKSKLKAKLGFAFNMDKDMADKVGMVGKLVVVDKVVLQVVVQ